MENKETITGNSLGRKLESCRMCESEELYEFLDLGLMPPADGILSAKEIERGEELLFPLKVAQCQNCGLTQLTYAANPQHLYGEKYKYESSITNTGVKHFLDMADSIRKKLDLSQGSLVVDIGSNVGVLLSGFKRNGMNVLGIDPAPKIAKIANGNGIETWQEFIGPAIAKKIVEKKGLAKVVTCTNVFAHIDDKKGLMKSINAMLDDDGVLIIEAPYFLDLVENMEYDTIYIDHLEYISIRPLISFFEKYGLEIFDVEKKKIHGGTLRIFVGKRGKMAVSHNVGKFLDLEKKGKLYEKETLNAFSAKVKKHKKQFIELLDNLKKDGKKIIGISAPAKGNTLLNYCKISRDHLDYMTEKSLIKIGHYTPGTHIPIVAEKKIYTDKKFPDYGVIFAWNFASEIVRNNQKFLDRGGKFINPIPYPRIMEFPQKEDLFGAKVTKITPDFEDSRGKITDLVNASINHVGLITTEAGAQRGPHYHKQSTQNSYILSGSFEVSLAHKDDLKNMKRIVLKAGEMISIPSFVIHGFKAREKATMIDISQTRGDTGYEADVVRINLEDLGE
jgi:quercetin dioxygenase-like cupin family protein/SAM-dependent methyltransferase|tara:strand:+ start:420 stop:2105 length:1686 start_codon:yes stop_codon:yes gene_type:complete